MEIQTFVYPCLISKIQSSTVLLYTKCQTIRIDHLFRHAHKDPLFFLEDFRFRLFKHNFYKDHHHLFYKKLLVCHTSCKRLSTARAFEIEILDDYFKLLEPLDGFFCVIIPSFLLLHRRLL